MGILILGVLCVVQDSCVAGDNSVVDLVDYCHRKLTLLASKATRHSVTPYDRQTLTEKAGVSSIEVLEPAAFVGFAEKSFFHLNRLVASFFFRLVKELQMQSAALEFQISLKALSVLHYITDHTERYGTLWTPIDV